MQATYISSEPMRWTLGELVVDVANSPNWSRTINGRKVQCLNGGVIIQRRPAMPRQVTLDIVIAGTLRSTRLTELETLWATSSGGFLVVGPGVTFTAFIDPEVNWVEKWQGPMRWITVGLLLSGEITFTGGGG